MKKYLMTGMAAVAFCAAFTSCSKEITPMTQEEMVAVGVQKIYSDYEASFQKVFGTPMAGHTWGFSDVASTRRADPGDGGAYFGPEQGATYAAMGIVAPDMVSAAEEKFVSDWFKANKDPKSDEIDLSTFFVQQVYFGTKEYTGYDANGAEHKVIGGQHMDWLCAGSDAMGDDHINNFNTSAPERYYVEGGWTNAREYQSKIMLMVNSSTKRFGCKESQGTDNNVYHNFVLKKLTFNGKVGYYVGFDYENHGQNGDFPKDGYYDDRIIKIVPGNGIIPPPPSGADIRVMAEDLSAGESGEDFDFNDVVFDVYFSPNVGEAYVMVQAAGGTLPLTVHGTEVHRLFGKSTDTMINTYAESKGLKGESGLPAQKIQLTGITVNSKEEANTRIKIFVTKEIKLADGSTTTSDLELVNSGAAACKIGVPPTTSIAVERTNVNSVLSNNQWVTNGQLWPTN